MKKILIIMGLTVGIGYPCMAQLSVTVSPPNNNMNVCTRHLTANPSGGSGNYSYTWGTTNSCTPTNNVSQSIDIDCNNNSVAWVFVTDNITGDFVRSSNISVSKTLRFGVSKIYPNVFTPNGDGYNDVFYVNDGSGSTGPHNAYEGTLSVYLSGVGFVYTQTLTQLNTPGLLGRSLNWDGGSFGHGTTFTVYVDFKDCTGTWSSSSSLTLFR